LAVQMDGRQMNFEVLVHDPFEVGYNAVYAGATAQRLQAGSTNGPLGTLSGGGIGPQSQYGGNQTGYAGYPGVPGGYYGPGGVPAGAGMPGGAPGTATGTAPR